MKRKCPMCGEMTDRQFRDTGEIVSSVVEKYNTMINAQYKDNEMMQTVTELRRQIDRLRRGAEQIRDMNLRAATEEELLRELNGRGTQVYVPSTSYGKLKA